MINTTSQIHVLFLDLQEIEAMENTELVVNQAEKCPANPVLPLGTWGRGTGCVSLRESTTAFVYISDQE